MQYFDFAQNWTLFYRYWIREDVQAIVKDLLYVHGFLQPDQDWIPGTPLAALNRHRGSREHTRSFTDRNDLHCHTSIEESSQHRTLLTRRAVPHDRDAPATSTTGTVESTILPHGCHVYAPALFLIAALLFPKYSWTLVDGDVHSTVVSEEYSIVFDLLCWYYDSLPGKTLDATDVYQMCLGLKKGVLRNNEFTRTPSDSLKS